MDAWNRCVHKNDKRGLLNMLTYLDAATPHQSALRRADADTAALCASALCDEVLLAASAQEFVEALCEQAALYAQRRADEAEGARREAEAAAQRVGAAMEEVQAQCRRAAEAQAATARGGEAVAIAPVGPARVGAPARGASRLGLAPASRLPLRRRRGHDSDRPRDGPDVPYRATNYPRW